MFWYYSSISKLIVQINFYDNYRLYVHVWQSCFVGMIWQLLTVTCTWIQKFALNLYFAEKVNHIDWVVNFVKVMSVLHVWLKLNIVCILIVTNHVYARMNVLLLKSIYDNALQNTVCKIWSLTIELQNICLKKRGKKGIRKA